MALSKTPNTFLVDDAETLVRELRRSVLKSCTEVGRMPTASVNLGEQMKVEHDATFLKAHDAGLFYRAGAMRLSIVTLLFRLLWALFLIHTV